MLNETVNVRVPKPLKEKMDQAVEKGLYTNRSDFVRNTIREKLKEEGEVT
jgi:Arc/MetJ-type ribon-helix-helix transcriptional regulator